ncbi:hypothetical protein ES703_119003 [subsurface metagenome]
MIISIIIFLLYFVIHAIFHVYISPHLSSRWRPMGTPYSKYYLYKDHDLNKRKDQKHSREESRELHREVNSW